MFREARNRLVDALLLLGLSLRLQLGRRFWVVPLLALCWPALVPLLVARRLEAADAQNRMIGLPLVVLAIGLGVGLIAGEIEQRTLEVTYTVPGGARRVWVSKLVSAALPLLVTGALLAIITAAFFTPYPLMSLYGALQGALFYLALAMALGALLRSEITAALIAGVVLASDGFLTGFGDTPSRWSPLFNPLAVKSVNQAEVLAWTVQNRVGVVLVILAVVALSCVRAERRERLLRV